MEEKESAFKKEVVRESKELSKQVKNITSKATVKVKDFSKKDFGKFKGIHVILSACIVLLIILCVSCCTKEKGIEYPLVYVTSDGDVKVLASNDKPEEIVKLSNDGKTYIQYSNTSNRYLLFEKNNNLYLFDVKKGTEPEKILTDVQEYYFSPDDSYIIAYNVDHDLYSIVPGKEKEKLEKDITEIIDMSEDKILYEKDDSLYIRSLKAKKEDKTKISESYDSATFSEDGKYVAFISEDDLYLYNISKEKKETIAKDVEDFACGEETCENMIYIKENEDTKDIYYYNGKKTEKIAKEVENILSYNVEEASILYKDDESNLYYKKGTNESYKVAKEVTRARFILDGESLYYQNADSELFIAKVKGNKTSKGNKIGEDVANLVEMDGKVAFVSDVDDNNCGDLYIATNNRSKKVDTDVYYDLTVNNDGSKLYYLKNYEDYTGDLYYTKGSKSTRIDTDVYYSYKYIKDDLIYYIKDYSTSKYRGDLYRYTGKSTKIDESVSEISKEANTGYYYTK